MRAPRLGPRVDVRSPHHTPFARSTLRSGLPPKFTRESAFGLGQRRNGHQPHRHLSSAGGLRPLWCSRRRAGPEGQVLRHPQRLARDRGTVQSWLLSLGWPPPRAKCLPTLIRRLRWITTHRCSRLPRCTSLMTPLIRSSHACRLARSQPRSQAANRATPRSLATLASSQMQKWPWGSCYLSLALRSSSWERGTTTGSRVAVNIEMEQLHSTWAFGPFIFLHSWTSRCITCRACIRIVLSLQQIDGSNCNCLCSVHL